MLGIYKMNISKINLNLLVALDALLSESNVSRAADKLFVTQSAMSNILKQLRNLFQDDLLVKNGRNMVLTLRAEELRPQLKQFLAHVEGLIQNHVFDPSTSTRLFIIGMEEYAAIILLPALYAYLSQHAPHIKIHIKNIPVFAEKSMLEEKEVELAIGLLHHATKLSSLPYDILFREKMVCIGKPNHPLLKRKISLKNYLAAKHVSFMPIDNSTPHIVDHVLNEMGYQRDIALRVSHIMPAIYTLEKSDLIATAPESIAKEVSSLLNFSVQECALDFPDSVLAQMWHPWTQADSGCVWLRKIVKEIAVSLHAKK
jgi:DNA-binding transcriptional LysR family regulator